MAAIFALVTVIVIGAMPGDKTDFWLPILILCIVALVLLLLASVFAFLDSRNDEDGWSGCPILVEEFIQFVFNAATC